MSPDMKYLPLNLFKFFTNVSEIHIEKSEIEMLAPKNGHFLEATNLVTVSIRNQQLKTLGPKIFEGAKELTKLLLDNNGITSLDEDTFFNLVNLKSLTLSSNEIKSLPEKVFTTLEKIQKIDLSSNILYFLPESLFDSNRFLSNIKLEHNRMMLIPPIYMSEKTDFNFLDEICVNQTFERTSKLNENSKNECTVDKEPFDFVNDYRIQYEIDQVCEDKNMLEKIHAEYEDLQEHKKELEADIEDLEFEILKTQIYKNSLC